MTFTKAATIGFGTGFAVALAIAFTKVQRPPFLVTAERKEHISKKAAVAKINDAVEDRELLFSFVLGEPVLTFDEWELVKVKALTEPRWARVIKKIEAAIGENE